MALLRLGSEELQKRLLEYARRPGIIRQSVHALRVGFKEKYYFDFDLVVANPSRCEEVVTKYASEINQIKDGGEKIDFLAFLEKEEGSGTVGAITLAAAVSIETHIPFVLVRLGKELRPQRVKSPQIGQKTKKREALKGLQGVLISDHSTTGQELLKGNKVLKELGAKISHAIVYTYREDLLKPAEFDEAGIKFHGFVPLGDKPPTEESCDETRELISA